MNKVDKGLLLFYDWEECFDGLTGDEFKLLLMAMIRYKKYGTPPPKFTGVVKVIASLLFPQLDRQMQDFNNGQKGGRPKKEQSEKSNKVINGNNKEEKPSSSPQSSKYDDLLEIAKQKKEALAEERAERARILRR